MRVQIGEHVELDGEKLRVVSISDRTVLLRDPSTGQAQEVLLEELNHRSIIKHPAQHADSAVGDDLAGLQHLDAARLAEIQLWTTCLDELELQLRIADAAGTSRSVPYQQCINTIAAHGRTLTRRTLYNKLTAYRTLGAAGLVDRRLVSGGAATRKRTDPRVIAALAEVIDAQKHESTGTKTRILDRARRLLDERFGDGEVPFPSRATCFRIIDEMDRGQFITGSARTRHSLANRPERPFTPVGASRPGEQVQIDSTKLDVLVQLSDGSRVRPELTIMLDVATRSIVAAVVRPIATKSIDLVVALARTLVPYDLRPGGRVETRALVAGSLPGHPLLGEEDLDHYRRQLPYIFPDTITTDRGRIFVSEHFRYACQRLGISLNLSAPYTPTDKAKVERAFKSINTGFTQHLTGYVGRGVEYRGTQVDSAGVLSLPQLQTLLDEWVIVEWQNRPHDGLRDPLFPSVKLSPNEMARAYRRIAPELHIPFDTETYLSLMPVVWRTVQAYGLTIDHRTYDSEALTTLRRMKSPYPGQGGKWPIHYDPYNVQTVWLPADDTWLPLQWVNANVTGPMSSDVWAAARTPGFLNRDSNEEARRLAHVNDILSRGASGDRRTRRAVAKSNAIASDTMRLNEHGNPPQHDTEPPAAEPPGHVAPVTPITPARFGLLEDD